MVNRGEEKVWVHMNVVPRSTLPRVVPCFPLLGLTPSGLFMGLSSTLIYTSELILCSTNRSSSLANPSASLQVCSLHLSHTAPQDTVCIEERYFLMKYIVFY